jgi:hypothetical protein
VCVRAWEWDGRGWGDAYLRVHVLRSGGVVEWNVGVPVVSVDMMVVLFSSVDTLLQSNLPLIWEVT